MPKFQINTMLGWQLNCHPNGIGPLSHRERVRVGAATG